MTKTQVRVLIAGTGWMLLGLAMLAAGRTWLGTAMIVMGCVTVGTAVWSKAVWDRGRQ
jgi:hypothetical protein